MALWKKAPKPEAVNRRRILEGVPRLSPAAEISEADGGVLVLGMLWPARRALFGRTIPPQWKRFELDHLGAFVVRAINGRRTVMDIARDFQERHQVSLREAQLGVIAFLEMLAKRGLVTVTARRGAGGKG